MGCVASERAQNPEHSRLLAAVGSYVGICWCTLFYNMVSGFGLWKRKQNILLLSHWTCDSLRLWAWARAWSLWSARHPLTPPPILCRKLPWAGRWELFERSCAAGDLRELSLNIERYSRAFPGIFWNEKYLGSLWKRSALKNWHINASYMPNNERVSTFSNTWVLAFFWFGYRKSNFCQTVTSN